MSGRGWSAWKTLVARRRSPRPGASPKSTREPYLKLPYASCEDGWYQRLRQPGKAMLLLALSLEDDFILPEGKAKPWYGLSADRAGMVCASPRCSRCSPVRPDYRKSPLTVTGWTEERSYTLRPPFGPHGRSRRSASPDQAATAHRVLPLSRLATPRL